MIVSIYPFASADSILYQISLKDNLKLRKHLKVKDLINISIFSHLANANVTDGGWSSKH